jgi:hypothetical protein
MATKIIIPFDPSDLRAGGRSLLVDQRGYSDMLRSAGNYGADALDRDLWVLRLLNAVPSLDPFLLRKHLRNNNIEVASSYFAISQGDQTPGCTTLSATAKNWPPSSRISPRASAKSSRAKARRSRSRS